MTANMMHPLRLNLPISTLFWEDDLCAAFRVKLESAMRVQQTQSFHRRARFCAAITRSNSPRSRVSPFAVPQCSQLFIRAHYEALSRAAHAVIRGYDRAGNVIETHEHAGQFRLAIPTFNEVAEELAEAGTRGTRE